MKTSPVIVIATGAVPLWACNAALAQSGNMMGGGWQNGWMGGYGGFWMPVTLLVLVIGLAVWIIKRK